MRTNATLQIGGLTLPIRLPASGMTMRVSTATWDLISDEVTLRHFLSEREVLKILGKGRLTMRRGHWIAHHKEPGQRQPGKIAEWMVEDFRRRYLISVTRRTRMWATITPEGLAVLREHLIDEAAEKFAGVDR